MALIRTPSSLANGASVILKSMKIVATVVSLAVTGGFAFLGSTITSNADSLLLALFGVALLAYSLASLWVLAAVWHSPGGWSRWAAYLAVACSALWILGSFDYGSMSGLEMVGAFAYSCAAALNWLSVRWLERTAA
jgi:hypothetical protein